MVTAANLIARIAVDGAESAEAKLLGVGGAAEETNAKLSRLALGGTLIAGAALVGLGALSVKMAADFQQVMLQSEALANVSKRDSDVASAAILQMAAALGQTPLELGKGFYYIASTGVSAKDSLIELALAAKAAAVGNTTTEITANALTAVLSTYGLKAKDAAKITDEMVASVAAGKTEFPDYAKVIGVLATNAKQAGISFGEATSAFSALSNVMTPKQAKDAADALLQTTSRFTVLEARAKSLGLQFDINAYKSMNLEDRLKYLQKITGGNVEEITKLIGRQNAMAAFTDLSANHFEMYNNVLQSVLHSHGDLDAAFAKTSSGFNAAMGRMNAATQVLLITVGNMLLPILTKLADAVTPMITAFTNWATSGHALSDVITYLNANTQTLVPILSGLGAMLLAIVVPAMITLAGSVIAATWPFLAVGVAVGGLVALLLRFHPEITTVSGAFQMLASTFQAALPYIQNTAIALGVFFLPALIKTGVEALVSAGRIAFNFVASLILTGAEGWAAAGKLAVFIAQMIVVGAQAVINAAKVTYSFIASLIATGVQAYVAAYAVTGSFVPALGIVGAQAVAAGGKLTVNLVQGLLAARTASLAATPAIAGVGTAATVAAGPIIALGAIFAATAILIANKAYIMDKSVQTSTGEMVSAQQLRFHQMATGANISATEMKNNVSNAANTMKTNASNSAGDMKTNVDGSLSSMASNAVGPTGSITSLTTNAISMFANMGDQVGIDMYNMDQTATGYWNDIADYINNHPITGTVQYTATSGIPSMHNAEGTDYSPGGLSWVGERGPEIMYIPKGAQIIPNNKIGNAAEGVGGGPTNIQVDVYLDGARMTGQLMPRIVQAVRQATGVRF